MTITCKDYFKFEIPDNWIVEEDEKTVAIYDNDGQGAITMSFFSIMELQNSLDEHICTMAKEFIDTNKIELNHALILNANENKHTLYGIGKLSDGWFIKIWVVAKFPQVVLATYQSEKKTSELKKVDKILDSSQFTL